MTHLQEHRSQRQGSKLKLNAVAIEENLRFLSGTRTPLCMVKADAYGLGMELTAPLLQEMGVRFFGVAFLEEAIELQKLCPSAEILVLHLHPSEAKEATQLGFHCAVDSEELLQALLREDASAKMHLHLNCGMNRLGLSPKEFQKLLPKACYKGVMTHLPCAGDPTHDELTRLQLNLFFSSIETSQAEWIHCGNSDACRRHDLSKSTMVRLGLGLFDGEAPLQSALTLTSSIARVHHVPEGEGVSYGRNFVTEKPSRIAVIPMGYADGIPHSASGKLSVSIQGKRYRQVGSVAMDFFMVDVTEGPQLSEGEQVELFGGNFSLHELSKEAGFLSYELLTNLSSRISRSVAPIPLQRNNRCGNAREVKLFSKKPL